VRRASLLALLLLSACGPRGRQHSDPGPVTGPIVDRAPTVADAGLRCASARCWHERAAEAEALGALDVAAAMRGQAHAHEPAEATLLAWVDALLAAGAHGRARAALVDARAAAREPGLAATLDARLAALPAPTTLTTIVPDAPADDLRAAYITEAAGSGDEAAAGFLRALATDLGPAHRARAGELLWARDPTAARRAWARARVDFDERGASLELIPAEKWFTQDIAWVGEHLALLRGVSRINTMGQEASYLQLLAPDDPAAPPRILYFPEPSKLLTFSADGKTLIRDDGPRLIVQDLATGMVQRRLIAGEVGAVAVIGDGDGLQVLAAGGATASLWDAGDVVARYAIEGTTPTIMRVYRAGRGTRHDNILRDDPTWITSVALAADGKTVALGGSDSKIRIFDRNGRARHVLAFAWPYVERRNHGGNPDLNQPLALRLDPTGKRLLAVHAHGDLIEWDLHTGKARSHVLGDCSPAEAVAVVNRHNPHDQRRAPSAAQIVDCGHASIGQIAPDGARVVTAGNHLRIRAADGAPIALFTKTSLPQRLAVATTGAIATTDLYGATELWRPGQAKLRTLRGPSGSGPLVPMLTTDGRALRFSVDPLTVTWDLVQRERSESTYDVYLELDAVNLSPDGRWHAEVDHTGLTIRDTATDAVRHRSTGYERPYQGRTIDFARDSSRVVWLESKDPDKPGFRVNLAPLTAAAGPGVITLDLDGWPAAVSLAPDLSEVLIFDQGGVVTRWRPKTGAILVDKEATPRSVHRVSIADDARTVMVSGYDRIQIHANDRQLTPLATLFPLLGGGWLVKSTAGAVDGSDDAVDSLVTRVRAGAEVLLFDGHLGWDAAHVPGLLTRALAGEDVPPPVAYRGPTAAP
jgi:hypothetical protein